MADALAREALGFCKEVDEATALDELHKKVIQEAQKLLNDGKQDESLRKAMEAVVAVSVHFKKQDCKSIRDKLQKTVNKALAYFKSTSDPFGEAHATKASAKIQVMKNRPEGAKKTATQAASLFRMKGDKRNEASCMAVVVDSLLSKADLVESCVRQVDHLDHTPSEVAEANRAEAQKHQEEAMNAAREVVELFRQANDKRGQADMLCSLADININVGEVERAKEVCMMSRDLYLDLDDLKGAQKALELEHNAHVLSFDTGEAINTALELVKMYRQAGNKRGEAEGQFLVMKTHFQVSQFEEVLKVGQDARTLCQRANEVEMEGIILDTMMKAQINLDNDAEALKYAEEAVEVYRKGGKKKGEAAALHTCAGIILDKFFKESTENVDMWRKSGHNATIFKDYDIEKYDKALAMVNEAEEIYTQLNDREGLALIEETQTNITIRATMMNEPDETKQIVVTDFTPQIYSGSKPVVVDEVIHTWYIPDTGDMPVLGNQPEAALADE